MAEATKGGGLRALHPPRSAPPVVAAYIRVSSRTQDYAYQRHAIEISARGRGELVHLWYGDVATGSRMDRPKLQLLREHIRVGRVQRLWVWRLDRLTRSGIVDAVSFISELRKHGCSVHSVTDGFPLDGPTADLYIAMIAWAAQHEREKLRENQQAARARMESVGRHWGRPPATDEQRALIRDLSLEGKSVRKIARELRALGMPLGKTCVWKILRGEPTQKLAV